MSLSFGAWAQSQTGGQSIPYDMDEECYHLYQEGSTLVGKPGFQEVNEQLYRLAVQKEDRRGKVFYYINRHRDVTRQPWETPAADTTARLQPGVSMKYVPAQEGTFSFRTDPRRVQQILINLLTNACKHTSSGEIRLGYSLEEYPGEVAFFVEDTGPGVPADKADAIFDRFTKLNDFVQGTGLGLSICREIAGRMGGRVFLDTSNTEGARFVFVLPLTPPVANND